jgi:hypothetical protein
VLQVCREVPLLLHARTLTAAAFQAHCFSFLQTLLRRESCMPLRRYPAVHTTPHPPTNTHAPS